MRVISGTARGTKLKSPTNQSVRPTLDRIKEDVFNILGPSIYGAQVLDLFAGSGALGIEALSRGAEHCNFVDQSRESLSLTRENLALTRLQSKATLHQRGALEMLPTFANRSIQFDLIFIDPPYAWEQMESLLKNLQKYNIMGANAVVIVETDKAELLADTYGGLTKYREKTFATTKITFYKGAAE